MVQHLFALTLLSYSHFSSLFSPLLYGFELTLLLHFFSLPYLVTFIVVHLDLHDHVRFLSCFVDLLKHAVLYALQLAHPILDQLSIVLNVLSIQVDVVQLHFTLDPRHTSCSLFIDIYGGEFFPRSRIFFI